VEAPDAHIGAVNAILQSGQIPHGCPSKTCRAVQASCLRFVHYKACGLKAVTHCNGANCCPPRQPSAASKRDV
jgi:hypothetical protein